MGVGFTRFPKRSSTWGERTSSHSPMSDSAVVRKVSFLAKAPGNRAELARILELSQRVMAGDEALRQPERRKVLRFPRGEAG